MKIFPSTRKGFTLLEVLLVVAIIAILAGIVIVAINPSQQLANSRNTQRSADVATILNAVYQYAIDNQDTLPANITATATEICQTGASSCTNLIDLSVLTASQKYLVALPIDPNGGIMTNGDGYKISKSSNNRVTISAPNAENGATISVTR